MTGNEINVKEFQKLLDDNNDFALIDVREEWEREIAKLPNDIHIPLSNWQPEKIPEGKMLIIYCHHGVRSRYVVDQLLVNNITNIFNLTGGINQWSLEIDKNLPTY
ncbi:rhodanese-like domain-containing protein [Francisellaceae bacterium]|nr:rhodanese-like domain-containing protein [Francisellaceae bacterium]